MNTETYLGAQKTKNWTKCGKRIFNIKNPSYWQRDGLTDLKQYKAPKGTKQT